LLQWPRSQRFRPSPALKVNAKTSRRRTTIRDGILFDAQALLREAEWYIEQEKERLKVKTATNQDRGAHER
jgi:hypothetical protein